MPRTAPLVLVADRDHEATRRLLAFLRRHGFAALVTHEDASARAALEREPVDCLVAPLHDRRVDGLALLAVGRERHPHLAAVLVTDAPDQARAVEAMRRGAADVQQRPLQLDLLLEVLRRGLEFRALAERVADMEGQLERRLGLGALEGESRAARRVQAQVRQLAPSRAHVLLTGEPGAGRSVVARALHWGGPRRDGPFVPVLCEALPESMAEAEVFGQRRSDGIHAGRLERADGGTLFLEEVTALSLAAQRRLVRALQRRAFERLGDEEAVRVDVRVIASTRLDPEAESRAGRLRRDLLALLGDVRIEVPPLRERREDIPRLAERLLQEAARRHGRRPLAPSRGVLDRLMAHDWPGNVRELRRVLEDLVLLGRGRRSLAVEMLPAALRAGDEPAPGVAPGMTLAEVERRMIEDAMRRAGGDKRRAAEAVGLPLRTFYRRVAALGLAAAPPGPVRPRGRPRRRG
jgi:DNA-binding NtrC family response regulator